MAERGKRGKAFRSSFLSRSRKRKKKKVGKEKGRAILIFAFGRTARGEEKKEKGLFLAGRKKEKEVKTQPHQGGRAGGKEERERKGKKGKTTFLNTVPGH